MTNNPNPSDTHLDGERLIDILTKLSKKHDISMWDLGASKSKDTSNRYFLGIENYTEVFYAPTTQINTNVPTNTPTIGYYGSQSLTATSRARGIDAAEVLPCWSTVTTTRSIDISSFFAIAEIILVFA